MSNRISYFFLVAGALCFSALMSFTARADEESEAIVGGSLVKASDPIAQSVVVLTDGNFICTGSIVDVDLVVSAGHCADGPAENMVVVFGLDLDKAQQKDMRPVVGYKTPPAWGIPAAKDDGDISLFRFSGGLPTGFKKATLLPSTTTLKKGQVVTLAGYGIIRGGSDIGAGVLRQVAGVPVYNPTFGKTEVELDQTKGKGACHGDSGGPAYVVSGSSLLLWGVTSRGYPPSGPDDCLHYSIYTRINAYTAWLSSAAKDLRALK